MRIFLSGKPVCALPACASSRLHTAIMAARNFTSALRENGPTRLILCSRNSEAMAPCGNGAGRSGDGALVADLGERRPRAMGVMRNIDCQHASNGLRQARQHPHAVAVRPGPHQKALALAI